MSERHASCAAAGRIATGDHAQGAWDNRADAAAKKLMAAISQPATKPGATETRPSPTSNNLARQIESAVEQLDAVNPDHKLPNVMVIVNHAAGRTRSDLHVTVTGIQVPDGPRLFTLKPDRQKQVWEAARRVDLFLWIDPEKRTCQHAYPADSVHREAACALFGLETVDEDEAASSSLA
jgi:hypothetical protein